MIYHSETLLNVEPLINMPESIIELLQLVNKIVALVVFDVTFPTLLCFEIDGKKYPSMGNDHKD